MQSKELNELMTEAYKKIEATERETLLLNDAFKDVIKIQQRSTNSLSYAMADASNISETKISFNKSKIQTNDSVFSKYGITTLPKMKKLDILNLELAKDKTHYFNNQIKVYIKTGSTKDNISDSKTISIFDKSSQKPSLYTYPLMGETKDLTLSMEIPSEFLSTMNLIEYDPIIFKVQKLKKIIVHTKDIANKLSEVLEFDVDLSSRGSILLPKPLNVLKIDFLFELSPLDDEFCFSVRNILLYNAKSDDSYIIYKYTPNNNKKILQVFEDIFKTTSFGMTNSTLAKEGISIYTGFNKETGILTNKIDPVLSNSLEELDNIYNIYLKIPITESIKTLDLHLKML